MIVSNNELSNSGIKVFPNPTIDKIHIVAENLSNAEVQLINPLGHSLISSNFSQQVELDMSNYTTGVYLVVIKLKDQVWTKRIVKRFGN